MILIYLQLRNGDDGKRHDDENLVVEKKFPTAGSTLTKELWVKLNKKLWFNKVLQIAGNDKLVNDLSDIKIGKT